MSMSILRLPLPKRCDRIRQCVALDLDGELSSFERALVDRHLESCAGCEAFATDLRSFTTALRTTPLEPLAHPVSLPSRRPIRLATLRLAVAGVAVVVVGAATLAGSLQSEQGLNARLAARGTNVVDEGTDELRLRQFRGLEARMAVMQPRPVGKQPV